jgi:hypothetical protein
LSSELVELDCEAALSCAAAGSMKSVVERIAAFSASCEGCASSHGGVSVDVLDAEVAFDEDEFDDAVRSAFAAAVPAK